MGSTVDRDEVSIAIVGLSCRFPGDGENLHAFWDSLCHGKSAWSEIPASRWKADSFWGPTKKQNTSITKGGHFINGDISKFDATFFGISSAEASAMDPQHRLMTEVAYEAVESAGLPLSELQGSKTGVWMGHFTSDYKELLYSDSDGAPAYAATGLQKTSLANRLSWLWDLKGPSFTLDTACSSSLVALHVACQSLRSGESDMGIVGGSNLLLGPEVFMYFGGQGFLSPDGKSKSFDISADGYGRGEGFAAVVLKRADDAIRDGDPIRAVIRGTACNQDGHTKGFTLPSHEAQIQLIKEVYQVAGLGFEQTGYVEAHGTGTQAGDTEETLALSQTIGAAHSAANKLLVGSVKANIGHLEAVAGLAAIVKSVLILENGVIPPNIHLKTPNPKIPFDDWNLKVPVSLTPFPVPKSKTRDGPQVRRVSVNSFGYGGTNAHAVLDDAASYLKYRGVTGVTHYTKTSGAGRGIAAANSTVSRASQTPKLLFPISSQDRDGLKRNKKALAAYLSSQPSNAWSSEQQVKFLVDLAFTLGQKRSRHQWKTYALSSSSSVTEAIKALERNDAQPGALSSQVPRLGFVFTGQGAQWAGMGMELFDAYPVFRESIEAADVYLRNELQCEWSAIRELRESDSAKSNIHTAIYSQPLCTVLQVALVDLLASWDIYPQAVTGHSSGEIAAAYCTGVLSRESAWKAAYFRGTLSTVLKEIEPDLKGAMMALGTSSAEATAMIDRAQIPGQVSVACINSPSSVTISGDDSGIDKMMSLAEAEGVFARKLRVDAAYHSHHMQMVSQDYMESIYDLQMEHDMHAKSTRPMPKMYTSVTGSLVTNPEEALGPAHWVKNLVSPVLFDTAIQNLVRPLAPGFSKRPRENAIDILVEVGPHSALSGPALQSLSAIGVTNVPYFSVLTRKQDGVDTALDLAGTLFSHGVPVHFARINGIESGDKPSTLVHLPAYSWNRSLKYWAESRVAREHRLRDFGARALVGAPCPTMSTTEHLWRGFLRLKEEPWVSDHKIQGSILYPGAGFLAMAIEGARQFAYNNMNSTSRKITGFRIRDVRLLAAMLVPADAVEVEHTLSLRPQVGETGSSDWYDFTVSSSADGKSLTKNCTGLICVEYGQDNEMLNADVDMASLFQKALSDCKTELNRDEFYKTLSAIGFEYGPCFANLQSISSSPNKAVGGIIIPDIGFTRADTDLGPEDLYKAKPHVVHPAFLDAVFHLVFAALMGDGSKMTTAMVPTRIDEIHITTNLAIEPGKTLQGFSIAEKAGVKHLVADMAVMDENARQPVLSIRGFYCSEVAGASSLTSDEKMVAKKYASNIVWRPHLDFMSEQKLVQWVSGEQCAATARTVIDMVAEYVKLYHHISPSLSMLELATALENEAESELLIASLARVQDFEVVLNTGQYVVNTTKATAAQSIEPRLRDLCDVKILEALSDFPAKMEDGEKLSSTDLLLISGLSSASITDPEEVLRKAKSLVSENGRLLLVERTVESSTKVQDIVEQTGFSVKAKLVASDGAVLVIESKQQVNGTARDNSSTQDVVLLTSPTSNDVAESFHAVLSAALSTSGFSPSTMVWDQSPAQVSALQGKMVISLLELQRAYWEGLSTLPDGAGQTAFEAAQNLILTCGSLFWVTGGSDPAVEMMTGILRVVRSEVPGSNLRTLNIFDSLDAGSAELVAKVFASIQDSHGSLIHDTEFKIEKEVIQVNRLTVDASVNDEMDKLVNADVHVSQRPIEMVALKALETNDSSACLKLAVGASGNFDKLHFVEVEQQLEHGLAEDELEVSVTASCLGASDVDIVSGQSYSDPNLLGMNAAGIVKRVGSNIGNKFSPGDSVMVLAPGAHRTILRVSADSVVPVPKKLHLDQAAAFLGPFVSAWYGLHDVARLVKASITGKKTILVHDALSAIGQQLLYLAKNSNLNALASVKSQEDVELLMGTGLIVNPDHILVLSTQSTFGLSRTVRRLTGARGVDAFFDCSGKLTGEEFRESVKSVASSGHFIKFVTADSLAITAIGNTNVTISNVDTAVLRRDKPEVLADVLQAVTQFLNDHDDIPVYPVRNYPASNVASAFREFQPNSSETAVLTYSENDVVPARVNGRPTTTSAMEKVTLDPEGIYVLSGGLGGLGRSLSTFFIEKLGARKILFLSRSGGTAPSAAQLLADLEAHPAKPRVAAYKCDVSDLSAVEDALNRATAEMGGAVKGVVQCAMVLRDVLWSNMTFKDWVESTLPKVQGTANLSKLLPDVDFFVSLSSFAGIFGNRGQANYAAGNCYLDALARYRRQTLGLRAGFTIDVPIMRGIGVLAESGMVDSLKDWEGPYGVGEAEFHHLLAMAIYRDMHFDEQQDRDGSLPEMVVGIATGASAHIAGIPMPFYLEEEPKFAIMRQTDMRHVDSASDNAEGQGKKTEASVQLALSQATDLDEAIQAVTQALVARVAKMQQVGEDEIDAGRFLHSYGVDSLVAIEIVSWSLKELKSKITVFDVTAGIPMTALAEKIARGSKLVAEDIRA